MNKSKKSSKNARRKNREEKTSEMSEDRPEDQQEENTVESIEDKPEEANEEMTEEKEVEDKVNEEEPEQKEEINVQENKENEIEHTENKEETAELKEQPKHVEEKEEVEHNKIDNEHKEKEISEEETNKVQTKEEIKPKEETKVESKTEVEVQKENKQENLQEESKSEIKEEKKQKTPFHKEEKVEENKEIKKTPSIHSNSSSINDFFSGSRHENAKRIHSQIVEIQNSALEYAKILINMSRGFEKMKLGFSSPSNYIFNSIFSILGYSYNSLIHKPNLFIFATQAWFLDLSYLIESQLKKEVQPEGKNENLKFSSILNLIRENETKKGVTYDRETLFLQNLGILTGNSLINSNHSSTTMLIENNIGKNFLHSVSDVIQNDPYLDLLYDVDRRGFEDFLASYFTKAVEKTLNIEMQTEYEGYIEFHSIYEELKKKKESLGIPKVTYEEFEAKVKEAYFPREGKMSSFEQNEIQICTETYYDYCQMRIQDILYDIKLFVRNYSSIIFKTKRLISQSYSRYLCFIKKTQMTALNLISGTGRMIVKNTEKIKSLSHTLTRYSLRKVAKVIKFSDEKMKYIKFWLDDSMRKFGEILNFPRFREALNAQICRVKDISNRTIDFAIKKCDVGLKKYYKIKEKTKEILFKYYENTSTYLKENLEKVKHLIIVEDDKECDMFKISIKKEILFFDPENFKSLYQSLTRIFRKSYTDVCDKSNQVIAFTRTKSNNVRNYMIEKYRRFIDSCGCNTNQVGEKKVKKTE